MPPHMKTKTLGNGMLIFYLLQAPHKMEVLIFPSSVGPNIGSFTRKHIFLPRSTLIFIFCMLKTTFFKYLKLKFQVH